MISLRSLSVPMLALVAVLAGCTAESGTTSAPSNAPTAQTGSAAQGDTTTPAQSNVAMNHRPGMPGGPEMLVGAALRAPINLTDAQKTTIQGVEANLRALRPAPDQAHTAALAAAIRSGNVASITPPAVDPAKQQARIAAEAMAIQTLHDTLTADQRTQLVTSIQSHVGQHHKGGPAFAFHGGEGSEGAVDPNATHMAGGPFLQGLNLTDAQKAQLQAMRPAKPSDEQIADMKSKFAAMRTEMNAKLETFKADTFDATSFVTPSANFKPMAGMDMHQQHLANLVQILTPAQREQLAQKIEQGPAAFQQK